MDLRGQRFGMLLVLDQEPEVRRDKYGKRVVYWACRCDCGKEITTMQASLRSGHAKSCGCVRIKAMNSNRTRNVKTCQICGKEYECPPSNNKKTCSAQCGSALRSAQRTGKPHPMSEAARQKAIARGMPDGLTAIGNAASMLNPVNQRGPQNKEAQRWKIKSPSGIVYDVINLRHWLRDHALDLFGVEATDANLQAIQSGFMQLKRSLQGKLKRANGQPYSAYYYKGWELLDYEERGVIIKARAAAKKQPTF